METIISILGWIFIYAALLVLALYLDARLGMHLTFMKEADIGFVMKGEELKKVILGLKKEDCRDVIESLKKRGIKWTGKDSPLARFLGVHYVSMLYPFRKLHRFEILAEGVRDGSEGKEIPEEGSIIREWLYQHRKEVRSLRWRFPRPVLVEGVELADRTKLDIIVMAVLEVEDPYVPIFVYKGGFFPLVSSFIESATIDLVVGKSGEEFGEEGKEMTYSHFVNMDKGEGSKFSSALRKAINEGDESEKKGLPRVLGIKAHKAFIFKYDLSKDQKELDEATRAEAIERMKAKGVIEKAKGDAKARRINAQAEARRGKVIVKALIDEGVDPNLAAEYVRVLIKTENIRGSGVTTWLDAESGGIPAIAKVLKGGKQ